MHRTKQQSVLAYIGLGSNMGDREDLLKEAVSLLHHPPSIDVICCSSLYETEPVGYVDQSKFLNMVIIARTVYSSHQLFESMVSIEKKLGRKRDIRWGPRTIDLDLLIYGSEVLETPDLVIPHPRMHERGFVLVPLKEIIAEGQPLQFEWVNVSLEKLDGKDGVMLWKKVNWHRESGLFAN